MRPTTDSPAWGAFQPPSSTRLTLLLRLLLDPGLGLHFRERRADPLGASDPLTQTRRHPLTSIVRGPASAVGVFGGIDPCRRGQHRVHFPGQPLVGAVGIQRGVRGDLRTVDRDVPNRASPAAAATCRTCVNSAAKASL
jgi:hypothetical protein